MRLQSSSQMWKCDSPRVGDGKRLTNFIPDLGGGWAVKGVAWLWFVDADERVPDLTGQLVNQWIREHGAEFEAINIPFKSYFCGR
jgi:hypothetical protein